MVICENEPAELPKDVVRSTTKLDDDISQFNLNLVSIWEKFELGTSSNNGDTNGAINGQQKQPGSAGAVIEKPSINIKQTLLAFEKGSIRNDDDEQDWSDGNGQQHKQQVNIVDRPKVKKLSNLNGFFDKQHQNNHELNGTKQPSSAPVKPLVIRRSESLMMRLKKYESRIAGEEVDEDNDNSDDDDLINNNNNNTTTINNNNKDEDSISDFTSQSEFGDGEIITEKPSVVTNGVGKKKANARGVPKKLPSIDLSSLKNRWENGDINKRRIDLDDDESGDGTGGDNEHNGNSPLIEKHEELCRIRQELARKRSGEAGPVKNIYENAIKKAQMKEKEQALIRRDSSDLSTLTGLSTTEIQQRLLQSSINGNNSNGTVLANGHTNDRDGSNETPNTPNSTKDHFQLNFSKKANKLKERFELGLINNSSHDDSDFSEGDEAPAMTKLEQIRQQKLEEMNVFKSGQSEAREARNLFKQIDKQISGATGEQRQPNLVKPRSFVKSKLPSMRSKLAANGAGSGGVPVSQTAIAQPVTVSTPPTPTTPTAAPAAAAPSSALNNNNNHHNQQPQPKLLEQQVEQKAQLQRVEPVQQKIQAEIKPKQKQHHIEEALPVLVSPIKQQQPQPVELKKQQLVSPQQQQQLQKLAESVQKASQVESLQKQEAPVMSLEKQSPTQQQQVKQEHQRAQQVAESRLHLEQVSCPVGQQKVESQPLRKQRQQSLPQQPKQQQPQPQQQQPEQQPRQQRQSGDNHHHQSQKQRQQQLVQMQQAAADMNRIPQQQLEQLIQSQPQQQKILENQPISLTNNCKNVNKLKVLQQTN